MLKTTLTVLVTATACFAIAATTGFAASAARVLKLKVGDRIVMTSNNFHCQVITKTQIACGADVKKLGNAVSVYYGPKQVNVVRFNAAGTNATVLFGIKR